MSASPDIQDAVNVLKEHIHRNYERDHGVESWRKLPEIPTAAEIIGVIAEPDNVYDSDDSNKDMFEDLNNKSEASLPENMVEGPWRSIADYVGTHYRLIREDAVGPLRKAVSKFKRHPMMRDNGEVSIYTQVYVVGMTFSNIGPAPRVQFSYERSGKRIRWKQSKRLQQGSVVALTPAHDGFKTICKVAVVAGRPLQGVEQNPPEIDLFWGDNDDAVFFDPLEEYIMVEARIGYFEAARHMLVAMQKLMTESFPLSDHLVKVTRSIDAPPFVKEQPRKSLKSLREDKDEDLTEASVPKATEDGSLENVDILQPWPTIEGTTLDQSQIAALRRILAKRLAIVQGPPGTGKTFVSVSGLKIMLDSARPGDSPIIVAAQTNHALDQLLRLIAPVEPNFLRLGGRTNADNLIVKERTLRVVRNKTPLPGGTATSYRNAKRALETSAGMLKEDIQTAIGQGDVEVGQFRKFGIITGDQFDSLYNDQWVGTEDPKRPPGALGLWLDPDQWIDPPRCQPTNIRFEEEEDPDFEELEEAEAETGKKDDDDIDALNGSWYPYKEEYAGRPSRSCSEKQVKRLLATNSDLYNIIPSVRGEVYRYLRRQLKSKALEAFRMHLRTHERNVQNMKVARWQSDSNLIRETGIRLIGCTTTGLSKYRGLLASLHPRTLLIEEAAETLEGTILAAMFPSLQQLILVGDHQQLQASCNNNALGLPPYNLSVSLFERLVDNGLEYTMLNKQRRMISELRELLNNFYPDLQDHDSVLDRVHNRKPIPGMGSRDSYFFHHEWPEARDESNSKFNVFEAEMIVRFFIYLVLNGTEPSKITVLTFYNGQRKVLLKQLRQQPELTAHGPFFNVFTVDSYQGEENDIIILSLVRSNQSHNIGFLENKHRAVVSLSRARRGVYIFGDALSLLVANEKSEHLWGKVIDHFRDRQLLDIHSGLPIVCSNHGTQTIIRDAIDWETLTGGCRLKCGGQLPCRHPCPYRCHPFSHEQIHCKAPCAKDLPCGHRCRLLCGDHCQCYCNSPIEIVHDEGWQESLDSILGDEPSIQKGGEHDKKQTARGLSISRPATVIPITTRSDTKMWIEFSNEAKMRDKISRQEHAQQSSDITELQPPIFEEIHRPITVRDGQRVRHDRVATRRVIGHYLGLNTKTSTARPDNPLVATSPQALVTSTIKSLISNDHEPLVAISSAIAQKRKALPPPGRGNLASNRSLGPTAKENPIPFGSEIAAPIRQTEPHQPRDDFPWENDGPSRATHPQIVKVPPPQRLDNLSQDSHGTVPGDLLSGKSLSSTGEIFLIAVDPEPGSPEEPISTEGRALIREVEHYWRADDFPWENERAKEAGPPLPLRVLPPISPENLASSQDRSLTFNTEEDLINFNADPEIGAPSHQKESLQRVDVPWKTKGTTHAGIQATNNSLSKFIHEDLITFDLESLAISCQIEPLERPDDLPWENEGTWDASAFSIVSIMDQGATKENESPWEIGGTRQASPASSVMAPSLQHPNDSPWENKGTREAVPHPGSENLASNRPLSPTAQEDVIDVDSENVALSHQTEPIERPGELSWENERTREATPAQSITLRSSITLETPSFSRPFAPPAHQNSILGIPEIVITSPEIEHDYFHWDIERPTQPSAPYSGITVGVHATTDDEYDLMDFDDSDDLIEFD